MGTAYLSEVNNLPLPAAADQYVRWRCRIFPLKPLGKEPLVSWTEQATTNPQATRKPTSEQTPGRMLCTLQFMTIDSQHDSSPAETNSLLYHIAPEGQGETSPAIHRRDCKNITLRTVP